MKRFELRHTADKLFSLILLFLFAFCASALILFGAQIYQNSVSYLDDNYSSRTAVSYLTEKIRQNDEKGSIFLTSLEEVPALCIRREVSALSESDSASIPEVTSDTDAAATSGIFFLTYLYFYDGALRELLIREDSAASLELGNEILSLSSLSLSCSPGNASLLQVTAVSPQEHTQTALIPLHCPS